MIKRFALIVVAFVAGVTVTTLQKDKEILQLQKRLKRATSAENHTRTFMAGWNGGREHERRVNGIYPIYQTNLN